MPSLLQKTSFYDPESGRTFVQTANGFYWKEAKKDPEDSKVTKLVESYGWKLVNGNDVWLVFRKPRSRGELTVIRGSKEWYYDLPGSDMLEVEDEGTGLDSLRKALETGLGAAKVEASAATAVNNAGNGHAEVEGQLRPDAGLGRRPDYHAGSILIITSGIKTASEKKGELYVSAVRYAADNDFKLANFNFTTDAEKAMVFRKATAANLVQQIKVFGVTAEIVKQAEESTLNGFSIESLEDFVGADEDSHTAATTPYPEIPGGLPPSMQQTEEPGVVKRDEQATEPEPEFLGARTREMSEQEMQDYMGRIMDWKEQEGKGAPKKKKKPTPEEKAEKEQRQLQKKKDKFNLPILHSGNIHIVNEGGKEYDTERLKAQIMERPSTLLKKNEKMKHSDGTATQFYNIGLPALKGLAVNEKTGKFIIVDTCPGAGACKLECYAMRGSYVQYPATSMGQSKILNFLVNHPDKFAARLKAEINVATTDVDEGEKVVVRWHDAGDFFSPQYMKMAFDVAKAFPEVEFYAYTKVAAVANASKPKNFIINFSEGALPSQNKLVNLTQIKKSVIVPQKMFWDLILTKGAHTVKTKEKGSIGSEGQVQFKNKNAWDEFKDRLAQTYQTPKESILHYDEYVEKKKEGELGDKPKWNVVVPPGAGDQAANDATVVVSFLMWH
jgi:hypothetical protein